MHKKSIIRLIVSILILGFLPGTGRGNAVFPPDQPREEVDYRLALILERLAVYQPRGSDPVLLSLQDYVHGVRRNPSRLEACESALAAFLVKEEVTPAARMEVCRQLRRIGTGRSVPALSRLLKDENSADSARYALEAIPGESAERALLDALPGSKGKTRVGIIGSLGARRSPGAVPALKELAAGPDPEAAAAAVDALGRIPAPGTGNALREALESESDSLRVSAAGALMKVAERARAAGDREEARSIFQAVFDAAPIPSIRAAAFQGRVSVSGASARDLLLRTIRGDDRLLREASLPLIPEVFSPRDLASLASVLEAYPARLQIMGLEVLTRYDGGEARAAVAGFLRSPEEEVRIAALKAMGRLGGGEDVAGLVRYILHSRGEEQAAARAALYSLRSRGEAGLKGVEEALLAELARDPAPAEEEELIRAVGARSMPAGRPALFRGLGSEHSAVRLAAARAIQPLVEDGDGPRLLDRLLEEKEETVRMQLVAAAAAAARRHPRPEDSAAAVESRLAETRDAEGRAILFRVLGRIGDDSTLPLIIGGIESEDAVVEDAAVRALAEWPTPAARKEQFRIARETGSLTHHVLCVRGFLDSVSGMEYESAEEGARPLIEALGICRRTEEKITVLGLLPRFPCAESLAAAESSLADPALAAEARRAMESIKRRIE